MVHPNQRPYPSQLLPLERLPGAVESKTRHQYLLALRQGRDARAGIHLDAEQIFLCLAGRFGDDDLAHMQTDAIGDLMPCSLGQATQLMLEEERKLYGVRRSREDEEERIAGGADFFTSIELAKDFADQGVMPFQQLNRAAVPQFLFKFCGSDDVREQETYQAGTMLFLKSFDAPPMT